MHSVIFVVFLPQVHAPHSVMRRHLINKPNLRDRLQNRELVRLQRRQGHERLKKKKKKAEELADWKRNSTCLGLDPGAGKKTSRQNLKQELGPINNCIKAPGHRTRVMCRVPRGVGCTRQRVCRDSLCYFCSFSGSLK